MLIYTRFQASTMVYSLRSSGLLRSINW